MDRARTRRRAALVVIACVATLPAAAGELRIRTWNDLFSGTRYEDDLYTGGAAVELTLGRFDASLSESLFTDRSSDLRFDETYLALGTSWTARGRWNLRAELGAVHVGEGIAGQGFQNWIHRLIDEPEVFLPYVQDGFTDPTLGIRVSRRWRPHRDVSLQPQVELYWADFKSHALAAADVSWRVADWFRLRGRLGLRHSDTDLAALERWMGGTAPVVGVGFEFADVVRLSWSENAYGTEDRHLDLAFRFRFRTRFDARESATDR